ncbi:MAG: DUF4105 domain-containing protein [Alphaproteobacteria bacterium]
MTNRFLLSAIVFLAMLLPCTVFAKETAAQKMIRIADEKELYKERAWLDLLHYEGKTSVIDSHSPFFLDRTSGYKNPKAEMKATIEAFFFKDRYDDEHAVCMFPARFDFLVKKTNISPKAFPKQHCFGYKEFQQKVPMDTVSIVFASENNMVPTSIMGHLFLKFSGETSSKQLREHAFSYFAVDVDTTSPEFYYDVLFSSVDGMYILSPYVNKKRGYLYEEQRSLWEVNLKMTDDQKQFMHKHIWELKEKLVGYSFVFHNCGTALDNLLKVPYEDLDFSTSKPFKTPIDYILYLKEKDKVDDVVFVPSPEYELKMIRNNYSLLDFYQARKYISEGKEEKLSEKQQYLTDVILNYEYSKEKISEEDYIKLYRGKNDEIELVEEKRDALKTKASSKIYMGYRHFDKDGFRLKYTPVYQEISDVSPAYFDDYETKILSLDFIYDHKFYLNEFDIIKMRSIVDASVSNDIFSKYAKVSFENALGEKGFRLKPVLEGGWGVAYSFFNYKLKPYFLPKVGYRYDDVNNFYASPEVGIIFTPWEDVKLITSYDKFYNSKRNNRGYNEKFSTTLSYDLTQNWGVNLEYNKYAATKTSDDKEINLGLGYHF